jgi:hypothetical protein
MARGHDVRDASIDEQSPVTREHLDFRYALYSAAHDARTSNAGANALLRLYAHAQRCRRAAEGIDLAEAHVENGFPKLAPEHLGSQHGTCPDCVRSACLTSGEIGAVWDQPDAPPPLRKIAGV